MRIPRYHLPCWLALALCGACGSSDPGLPEPPGDAADSPTADSAILIVVDTLRADHLGCYGYERDTTPHIDRASEEAALFTIALSTAPWTLPAFGSIYTGHLPSRHGAGTRPEGVDQRQGLDPELPTLAEVLGEADFDTAACVNNPWLKPRQGLDRGFGTYDYRESTNRDYRRADQVVDFAIEWMGSRTERYFLLLHVFDPHLTYDPPPSFAGRFSGGMESRYSLPIKAPAKLRAAAATLPEPDRAFVTAAYDEEVAFVDQELGRLLEHARRVHPETLVILTSDHGEEFFEHGGFEHGHTHYQELLHVPLLVWGPGVVPGRVGEPVSLVDLAPTILAALGVEEGLGETSGRSLWPLVRGEGEPLARALVSETTLYGRRFASLTRWPLKVILEPDNARRRMFDLAADPAERRDLVEGRSEEARLLVGELRAIVDAGRAESQPAGLTLDEETLRELAELGYVE